MTYRAVHRPDPAPASRPGGIRRGLATLLLLLVPQGGCYSTRALTTAPAPGTTLVFELNDQARVALADRLGQSAERVKGTLQSVSDSGYTIRVASVRYLNGQQNDWSGELFTVPTSFTARVREQQFSKSRTLGVIAVATAAVIAIILKTNLVGGGSGSTAEPRNPGGTGGT